MLLQPHERIDAREYKAYSKLSTKDTVKDSLKGTTIKEHIEFPGKKNLHREIRMMMQVKLFRVLHKAAKSKPFYKKVNCRKQKKEKTISGPAKGWKPFA